MGKYFLPITVKEMSALGWEQPDVVLVSGDAYVDHASFGAAIIGRLLEREGLKVAILPQPNWQDDLRDFKKFGPPRLFFAITSGNMDSMVNHYTAQKRLRHDDAYTPGGKAGFRPDYATSVYCRIVKQLYPTVPVIIGGIEASMRRLSHYDYWSDSLKPSILIESGADLLIYGMAEKPVVQVAHALQEPHWQSIVRKIPQVSFYQKDISSYKQKEGVVVLHAYEQELQNKKYYGENFTVFERESNRLKAKILVQPYHCRPFSVVPLSEDGSTNMTDCGGIVVNPPFLPATEMEMDSWALYDNMMNAPHPKYDKRGTIPAFEMIKNSITVHRGCFGGCSFCTISAHQGKFIASRSMSSILDEAKHLSRRSYFKGHISDLGGPSANMYRMGGKDRQRCEVCSRASCLVPRLCPNLNIDHHPLVALYRSVLNIPGIKTVSIGSGIRYEMLLAENEEDNARYGLLSYLRQVVSHHVSGRLKVAPEHTCSPVLKIMRKPPFDAFKRFIPLFNRFSREAGKKQQLIPYFISAHPGCTREHMQALAKATRASHLLTEQVQTFTPTPMTYSTALYFLGYDPYTGEKIPVCRDKKEREQQHLCFFSKK
ncbi:MAG: YgiQ family radical SAM protein [Bacteroidales bacterium]|jgi:uncharacterized radical SAM protein YgiQ|nr:YgiQ family radical SAM protein [Bacteroidales bacterium]